MDQSKRDRQIGRKTVNQNGIRRDNTRRYEVGFGWTWDHPTFDRFISKVDTRRVSVRYDTQNSVIAMVLPMAKKKL